MPGRCGVRRTPDFWAADGLSAEHDAVLEAFRAGAAADDPAAAVPDRMVEAVTAAGTAEDVRRRRSGRARTGSLPSMAAL
ncbi:hypothetical protein ACU686_11045 [Yinghuangia aomiensis]